MKEHGSQLAASIRKPGKFLCVRHMNGHWSCAKMNSASMNNNGECRSDVRESFSTIVERMVSFLGDRNHFFLGIMESTVVECVCG